MFVKKSKSYGFLWRVPFFLCAFLVIFAANASNALAAKPDPKLTEPAKSNAASTTLPRWWGIVDEQVAPVADEETLYLNFFADETLCRARYGDQWYEMCQRRTDLTGRPVLGPGGEQPALNPAVPGEWRWQSDMSIAFKPEKAWPADIRFSVTLPTGVFPNGVIVTDMLSVESSEVLTRMEGEFKFDPQNPQGKAAGMGLAGAIAFNYPMDKESVLSRLSVNVDAAEGKAGTPLLGKPDFQWGPSGSNVLLFSVPVLELPEDLSRVRVALAAGSMATSGGKGAKASEFSMALPGKRDLFRLTGAEALMMATPDLGAKQTLALQFSMPVMPSLASKGLEILLLPRQRVDTGDKNRSPYSWWSKSELSPEVRKRAETITCTASGNVPSMLVSLTFDRELEAGRSLLVTLPGGLKSASGYSMADEATFLVQVPAPSQDLRIMQNGAVLALPGEKTLSLYSRNLDTITYEVMQVRPEYVSQLVASRPDFVAPYMYSMSLYNVGEVTRGEIPLVLRNAESPQFSALDLAPMLKNGQKGFFIVSVDGVRNGTVVSSDRRFVLVTDIGLISKKANDGASQVFTVSLSTGKPMAGVTIRVLGANGLPVFQAESDGQGLVNIPDLDGLQREKKPRVLLASVGDDLSFLPINDMTRQVNYYGHDTGRNAGGNVGSYDGLVGWMFGQRGIYRPGEIVHFGYVVKHGDWTDKKSLKGLPLRVHIYDPRSNLIARHDVTLGADGFGELEYALPETAVTGKYAVDVMLMTDASQDVSLMLMSDAFQVEEFQPDTMKLTVRLEPAASKGWLWLGEKSGSEGLGTNADINALIELSNLFGTPAAERRVTVSMQSSPAWFSFREYSGWNFYNAAPFDRSFMENLPESATDAEGKVTVALPSTFYRNSSMVLDVRAEGFDAAGGRSVRANASMLVSPLPWVLGWKTGSNLEYLRQNSEATLDLLAIAHDLQPLDPGPLTLETVSVSYLKSLIRDEQGQYRYDMVRQEKVESTRPLKLPAKGSSLKLDLSLPGEWRLVIRDTKGLEVASIPYVVAGTSPAAFGEDRQPVLTARLDKSDYAPGTEMEIFLTTPYKGTGLVTVERDKVESFVWFNAEAGNTVQRLRLPKNFEGKAYINVLYFRALDDKDIFTTPLAVAVLPFTVNMESRDAKLSLRPLPQANAPLASSSGGEFVARPGTLKVEVKANKPCRAVVFAVDEGILQLTSYATPNPLQALLGDRALGVTTSQYFDLLMPEYSLMKRALSAFGGGEGLNYAALGQNAFRRPGEKSAVFWSGMIELNGSTVVDIPTPPSFSGRLRIMAVGVGESQVGVARTDVLVRPDVVIQPSLPLFAAPGDEFEAVVAVTDMSGLPVTPGNEAKGGRKVVLTTSTEGGLEVLEAKPQTLFLQPEREQQVVLRLRALDNPGGATLTIHVAPTASDTEGDGKIAHTVSRPVGMSIRPASPRTSQVMLGRAQESKGQFRADIPFTRTLYSQHAALSASMSAVPLPVAHGLFRYAASYPFSCTEQVISGAFPALFMLRYPPFAPQGAEFAPDVLRQRVLNALAVVQSRMLDSGELAMWPGGYASDLFYVVYAADFITAAEEMGVSVDVQMKVRLLNYLTNMASSTPVSSEAARVHAYAAWVLTRNGVLTSNILATLTAWLESYQPGWRDDITSVFMAGCWRLMMENTEARKLLDAYTPLAPSKDNTQQYWMNGLTTRSLYLSVVAGQFPEMLTSEDSQAVVAQVLDLAATGYYDTQSAAQASRALLAYSAAQQANQQAGALTLQALDAAGTELAMAPVQNGPVLQASLRSGEGSGADILPDLAALRFSASAPFYWQVESTGYDRVLPTTPVSEGLEVRREFVDANGKPVTSFRQGDELIVIIRARAYGKVHTNVAIVDMLPGCFEMVMAQGGSVVSTASALNTLPNMSLEHVERREDRLLLFPTLSTQETAYAYRVRVTSRGSFVVPPLTADAMYDPRVRASTVASKMIVE